MIAPPMFVLAVLMSMTMMLSGIAMVDAQCRAPLTVILTAQNYWETWVGKTSFMGPYETDHTLAPYLPFERVTNITVYVERSTIAIGVSVDSIAGTNTSFMASVSYNGVKLATTGDVGSRWEYTTDYDEISNWMIYGDAYTANELAWAQVNSAALCNANTVPSISRDGLSFSKFISANGVTPSRDSPQFGGDTARWIGINENKGDCSAAYTHVVYRMTLDLTTLVDDPICFPKDDGRSALSADTPIVQIPKIGLKSPTSQEVTVFGGVEGVFKAWVDGIGAEVWHGYVLEPPEKWATISTMDFNIEPKKKSLVAFHIVPWILENHQFIANILYKGQLFAASDNLAQWKIYIVREYLDDPPEEGWNTDPYFDDSTWESMSDTVRCNSTDSLADISRFLNKTYGGCANWLWHKNFGCEMIQDYTDLFVRISLDLVDEESRPALECSMPLPKEIVNQPKNADLEIVAIALSATIGSLIMIAAYLFIRRYRSRRSKTKMLSYIARTTKTSNMVPPPSSKWAFWPTIRPATTSYSSTIHLANLSNINISTRPHLMGDLGKTLAMRTDNQSGSIARTARFSTDNGTNSPAELIKAYQSKQRSVGLEKLKLQRTDQSATRTMTHGTRTEFTLVDGTSQGLELPGFLQLKEGIDFNLVDEYAVGGGGSLFSGRMFARGLPSLKVIVKKMTNSSLPAFRQEVALMWLFNDNENMVKLMGFNETQLAIVMPEYNMGSLKRFIDVGDYDIKVARSLLLDIAKGISTMHERGVVHNDIKPDNVLLEPHPTRRVRALLTDFGISNVVEDKVLTVKAFEVKTKAGLTVGYAAPEAIARFRNKDLSRVSPGEAKAGDVYSFAIVIHALVTRT